MENKNKSTKQEQHEESIIQKNEVSDAVTEVEVILERIYVLSNDLDQGYFEQDIKKKDDMWKIAGSYYEHAGIKTNMILNMAYDVQNKLTKIQEMV